MDLPVVKYRDQKVFEKENAYWLDYLNGKKYPWYASLIKILVVFPVKVMLFPFKSRLRKGIWASVYLSKLIKARKFKEGYLFGLGRLSDWKTRKPVGAFGPAFYTSWWSVFRGTCQCALKLRGDKSLKALSVAIKTGPEPQAGHEVSFSYCDLARLFWLKDELEGAWQLVQKAIECDETQGYAYYLRAWFGVRLKKGPILSDLITAVQHEPELKKAIFEDEMFKVPPELLETLKAEVGD